MKNRLAYSLILLPIFAFLSSCSSEEESITDPPISTPCESASSYEFDSLHVDGQIDSGMELWFNFDIEDDYIISVNIDQGGFDCVILDACDVDTIYSWQSTADSVELGVLNTGDYYLSFKNVRPGRINYALSLGLIEIVYGCTDPIAQNYNPLANVDNGNCAFPECPPGFVIGCNGLCAPETWIGDGWCDDGTYGYDDGFGLIIPVDLMCEEFNWDEGDCEPVDPGDECMEGLIRDCEDNCAPEGWIGDGYCDEGEFLFNGIPIHLNCEEHNWDGGDCDAGAPEPIGPKLEKILIK